MGAVPRAQLEAWLQTHCRPLLAAVDAASILDLLLQHTYGEEHSSTFWPQLSMEHLAVCACRMIDPTTSSLAHTHLQVLFCVVIFPLWAAAVMLSALMLCAGVSGRYVHYLNFLQDLEQLVMAAQDAQVRQVLQGRLVLSYSNTHGVAHTCRACNAG